VIHQRQYTIAIIIPLHTKDWQIKQVTLPK